MIGRLSLRDSILVIFSTLAISAAIGVVVGSYATAKGVVSEQAYAQLTGVRELKAAQIQTYFGQIEDHLASLAVDRMVVDALHAFPTAVNTNESSPASDDAALRRYYDQAFVHRFADQGLDEPGFDAYWPKSEVARQLQRDWVAGNEHAVGSKHLLDSVGDDSAYDVAHRTYHPALRTVQQRFGYYDLFLIEPVEGRVVYSVFKEVDFGTSVTAGPWRESGLGEAFRAAVSSAAPGSTHLVDFKPYGPSYGAAASFMASPVFDDGVLVGVLVVQMPIGRINDIMTNNESWADVGLGKTGETYLVGGDYRLRNQSRFLIEDREAFLAQIAATGTPNRIVRQIASQGTSVGLQEVRTPGSEAALSGHKGTAEYPDYRGVPVLSSYAPLQIDGVQWAVISEIDAAEALAPALGIRNVSTLLALAAIAVIMLGALVFARTIVAPVRQLADKAAAIASGDLDVQIDTHRGDELGDLARQFDRMRVSVRDHARQQDAAIKALSVPIIPLNEETLVLPLVGILEPERVDRMRRELIRSLHSSRASTAIVDITGVPSLKLEDAQALVRMGTAAHIIGARVILTGVSPEVASDIIEQNVDMGALLTERTLASGIERALAKG